MEYILVNPRRDSTGIEDDLLRTNKLACKISFQTPQFLTALSIMQRTYCVLTAPNSHFLAQPGDYRTFEPPLEYAKLSNECSLASKLEP